jgi:ABC-type sugar transport system permease subunit
MEQLFARKRYIALFVGPALLVYAVFGLAPLLYNIYVSFFKTNLLGDSAFIGVKNYAALFSDQFFRIAVRNAFVWIASCYAAQVGCGLLLAYALFQKIKGSQFFQSAFFMPSVICGTAIGLLWTFVYHPNYGLLNNALGAIGLGGLRHNWLADEKTALPALVVICMWQFTGYHMVILLSGMRWGPLALRIFLLGLMVPAYGSIIPLYSMFMRMGILNQYAAVIIPHVTFGLATALEEAAIIDGCSVMAAFWRVICPLAAPGAVTVAVISFVAVWNDLLFSQIFLNDQAKMPLPIGLMVFKGMYSTDHAGMIAAVVITVIPVVAVYTVLHKYIVEGMIAGAVKG